MSLHLMATVSDDSNALMGLRFINGFFDDKQQMRITVFYTAPRPPALWEGEINHASLDQYEQQARVNTKKGKRIVDDAMKMLVEAGFSEKLVEAKTIVRNVSKVEDILREGETGLYDALVMGRRGTERLEDLMNESISDQLALCNAACPLWVCRNPEPNRNGVLLCLDGSDASLRTTDHVGFIVANLPRHHVTMLRVQHNGLMGGESSDSIFLRARTILLENGVDPDRIHEKVVQATSAPKALLAEAGEGEYAAVAIGRTGRGRSLLHRLFMGSAGRTLLRELNGAVLWMRS